MRKKIGTAMVVGAGISGIRTALDLAEFGYGVTLVDKSPNIGGILSQLDYQFPTDGCGMCKMLPLVNRDASSQYCLRKGLFHENIKIILGARLTSFEGEPGKFKAKLEQKPTLVDPDLCIGCGKCTMVCPVDVPDSFNMGLSKRKAIYLPVPHNIPNTYVIDFINCNRCKECVSACPTNAIRFPEEKRKDFHILVVDDELIVRDSLKEWLEYEGFSVEMADSGQTALDMLAKKQYHLLLTDIKMPGMDGVEVLKNAKKSFPDLAVVMMTAYATVKTAVEAMKTGAVDYLLKPFDPKVFITKILEIYQAMDVVEEREFEVNALVLSTGTDYFDPLKSKNTFGYGVYPDIVTSREFERLLSGTGPGRGIILRQSDQKPVRKIAWFQCVGSRDLQDNADFCSSVCCMHAIKEARLVKEKSGSDIETTIFYMDMRVFGKSFHQYQTQAISEHGIQFERSRVHTVIENTDVGGLQVYYVDQKGSRHDEQFDMIVLSVGQRPSKDTGRLAKMAGLTLNEWGFCQPEPFSTSLSGRDGVVFGGSFAGLKDISESIIRSSSAALAASRFIHSTGGSLSSESDAASVFRDVSRELPKILVVVCTCQEGILKYIDEKRLKKDLMSDPTVNEVIFMDSVCTAKGWSELTAAVEKTRANRILIGACLPYVYTRKTGELGTRAGIHPGLMDAVDIHTFKNASTENKDVKTAESMIEQKLRMGFSRLKRIDPSTAPEIPSVQKALVVGGGIAGMTAALAIADHGFKVDLIESEKHLGGNLSWLQNTIQGASVQPFLEETIDKVEKHPLLTIHTDSIVTGSSGSAGRFLTTARNDKEEVTHFEHGAVILATGGTEAPTSSYGYGTSESIITHKQLEQNLVDKTIKPEDLESVVMIQCVDSRQENKKDYCSRICCSSTLKNALNLKKINPDIIIYVFYRDMMAHGFLETYYTQARKEDIIFIQYDLDHKPDVTADGRKVTIIAFEPIIGKNIEIKPDLIVLATGVVPSLTKTLAQSFGAKIDSFGFFQEAESKWRPVDSLKEGVFACGLSHSPRNITETVASAEASAQRALRILGDNKITAGTIVARIHHSLCSLCERCVEACPYEARSFDPDLQQIIVNPVMCQGCGSCAVACPNSACFLTGFMDQQMFDVIDSAFKVI